MILFRRVSLAMLYSEKEIFLKYGVAIIADDSAKPLDF